MKSQSLVVVFNQALSLPPKLLIPKGLGKQDIQRTLTQDAGCALSTGANATHVCQATSDNGKVPVA